MDNIRYGREDATEQEIIDAAKIANADDFIRRFPKSIFLRLVNEGSNYPVVKTKDCDSPCPSQRSSHTHLR